MFNSDSQNNIYLSNELILLQILFTKYLNIYTAAVWTTLTRRRSRISFHFRMGEENVIHLLFFSKKYVIHLLVSNTFFFLSNTLDSKLNFCPNMFFKRLCPRSGGKAMRDVMALFLWLLLHLWSDSLIVKWRTNVYPSQQ